MPKRTRRCCIFREDCAKKGYPPDLLFRVLSGSPRSAAILRDLGSCARQSLSKKLQRGEPLRNCHRARGDGELPLKYFIEVLSNRNATEKPSCRTSRSGGYGRISACYGCSMSRSAQDLRRLG